MHNSGVINCFYHAENLNSNWCVICGCPICSECVRTSYLFGIDFPACPPCYNKRANIILGILIPFLSIFMLILLSIIPFKDIIFEMIILMIPLFIFIVIFIGEKKNYEKWFKTRNDRPILDEEIRKLITEGVIIPCSNHAERVSIGTCQECGMNICVKCTKIKGRTRYSPAQFLCVYHHWLKIRKILLRIIGILGLIMLIPIIIILSISSTNYFMGVVPIFAFAFCTPLFVMIIAIYAYYIKIKWDYYKWRNEVGFIPEK